MKILITCVLENKRKLMRIVEGQTGVKIANVSISSADLDRKAISVGDKFVIDGEKLRWITDYNYYTYRGDVTALEESDWTPPKSLKTELQENEASVCPNINEHGFYLPQEKFTLLVRNIKKGINTMLLGATGTGKTQSIQLIAKQLNIPCRIYDMGAMHDPISDLLGVHRLVEGSSVFDYARFVDDVQQPGIIVLDELSRCMPTCLNILFPVLDHRRTLPVEIAGCKDTREVKVHDQCVFVATANIGIEYTGTSTLDKALSNRFFPIEFDYLSTENEAKVLEKRSEIITADAQMISSIANKLRNMYQKSELSCSVSTRETLMISDLVHDGWSLVDSLKAVLLPLYDGDERNKVLTLLMGK